MGTRTTRITAEDFLIPPEFRSFHLAERSAGQIGGVSIELLDRAGSTFMGHCYQQVPLRVLPPFRFEAEPAALLYLLNPTVGLMDGDGHLIELHAAPGARAVVTGQSASRLHPAVSSFATQQWRVKVDRGASLVILPGPVIPFQKCRYFQSVRIDLEGDARLVWGDIWTPGRYSRGHLSEHYQFERIVQQLEVWRDDVLVYRDRFCWDGPWNRGQAKWHFGEANDAATASLFVTGGVDDPVAGLDPEITRAKLQLSEGDTLFRYCGPPENLIAEAVGAALQIAGRWHGGPTAPAWLLDGNHLGSNHWFARLPNATP